MRAPLPKGAEPPTSGAVASDGILVVDKPLGLTSHDVVSRVRRLANTRKIGHAGTLDPLASGVLVLGIGRATRLLGHLALRDKTYDATIRLGQATVTDDAEGDITFSRDAGELADAALERSVRALTGELQQVPSAVSAIKVGGQRAYARVRAGEEVMLAARSVRVSAFELRHVRRLGALVDVDVHVECSTGTYVRALARDLGAALGVGGHLTALRRTRVGTFSEAVAASLEELAELAGHELPVISMDAVASSCFATYTIADDELAAARNGRPISADLAHGGPVAVLTSAGEFVALYEQDGRVARPVAVFAPAQPSSAPAD